MLEINLSSLNIHFFINENQDVPPWALYVLRRHWIIKCIVTPQKEFFRQTGANNDLLLPADEEFTCVRRLKIRLESGVEHETPYVIKTLFSVLLSCTGRFSLDVADDSPLFIFTNRKVYLTISVTLLSSLSRFGYVLEIRTWDICRVLCEKQQRWKQRLCFFFL